MYFMSIEVDGHAYLHTSKDKTLSHKPPVHPMARFRAALAEAEPEDPNVLPVLKMEASEGLSKVMKKMKASEESSIPFRYNPLHDIESLWWLALFLSLAGTIVYAGADSPGITDSQDAAQQRLSEKLFCDPKIRINTFINERGLRPFLLTLHPRVAEIGAQLEEMRSDLTQAFSQAEKDMTKPVPFLLPSSTYEGVEELLKTIIKRLAVDDVQVTVDEKSRRRLRERIQKQQDVAAPAEAAQNSNSEDARPAKKRKTLPPAPLSYSSRGHAPSQLRRSQRITSRPNTTPK